MTDTAAGREPRFSDDRSSWWDGTQWLPASQAPIPPPPPTQAPIVPPSPSSPVSAPTRNTYKVKGGSLTLNNGDVTITRSGKVETVAVADVLSIEARFISPGCLGGCLATIFTLGLIWMIPGAAGSWGVDLKTQTGVLLSVPVGKKRDAIAIQQVILAAMA